MLLTAILLATVTGSGATQHAGEDYTLTCTVSGGETTATTTYQWHRNNSPLSSETSATLSFTPLSSPSSNGQYVCEAMRSSRTARSGGSTITVSGRFKFSCKHCSQALTILIAPTLTLVITPNGSPIEGQTYSLTCDLMGDESLDVPDVDRRYRWDKVRVRADIHRTATLSFTPLSRDDEGEYKCTTNIMSPYLTNSQTRVTTTSFTVIRKQECF